ncbi:MAG: hypothetical protein ACRCXC_12935 [Legionella sp.]
MVELHAINKYGVIDRLKEGRKKLHAETEDLLQQLKKLEQQKNEADALLAKEKEQHHKAINDPKEAEYLLLISTKLLPLTKDYLTSLRSRLPETLDESDAIKPLTKEEQKVQDKIDIVTELLDCLENQEKEPKPIERLRLFYNKLDKAEEQLKAHRDLDWFRYTHNAIIAA